jgi:heat shock protein HslJ
MFLNTRNTEKTTTRLLASILLVAAVTACKVEVSIDENPAASVQVLQSTAWWVEDIGGTGVIDASHTTLDFSRAGQVAGDSGCNRYTARAQVGEGTITFGTPGGTRMMCPPAIMNQEAAFYEAITNAASWEIAETGLLYLRDAGGNDLVRASATDDP